MNNNVIILPTTLHQSPDYWQNFIRHYKDNIMKIEDSIDRGLYVNYILYSEFNATLDNRTIEFTSPEYKTWFILKWS